MDVRRYKREFCRFRYTFFECIEFCRIRLVNWFKVFKNNVKFIKGEIGENIIE